MLIHLHIPKNGGTTLSRMVKLQLLRRNPRLWLHPVTGLGCGHLNPAEPRMEHIANLPLSHRQRVLFFEAHRGYGAHTVMGVQGMYFTMLREPVARAISVYKAVQRDGDMPDGMSLRDFLMFDGREASPDRPWVWPIDNAQVRYLAGDNGRIIDVPPGQVTSGMLDKAIERLDTNIDIVGLLERFDESVVVMMHRLGWRGGSYARSNTAGASDFEADADDRSFLREHNLLDIELHEHAQALLAEKLAQVDPAGRRVAKLQARSRRSARLARPFSLAIPAARRPVFALKRLLGSGR